MKKIIAFSGLALTLMFAASPKAEAQISKQGKGAIIGGAGGAVAGGLIGKSVGGAVIGGAIGAGGGYIIGNEARKREEKRKRQAYLRRRAAWKRAHPGKAYPY
ncbi:cell envelope biogenesis protein OmpA [Mucilaginibacter pallidiroseus]|uniref:Cell envelope biogenesis protein OmpA n=1 Tax=Mucilaginibacter pallidiroseus TaxID=2599295 RepID=A0A563U553_9SPHI|nr:cell envelope biogenesis protein OmpA [Mucilaginibacter pallidiroseus]TWR26455.1 cell envelope biogenesis protein OmpA [Mucilaginibacter pallidiroseus]